MVSSQHFLQIRAAQCHPCRFRLSHPFSGRPVRPPFVGLPLCSTSLHLCPGGLSAVAQLPTKASTCILISHPHCPRTASADMKRPCVFFMLPVVEGNLVKAHCGLAQAPLAHSDTAFLPATCPSAAPLLAPPLLSPLFLCTSLLILWRAPPF